jgi:hypothetical protein
VGEAAQNLADFIGAVTEATGEPDGTDQKSSKSARARLSSPIRKHLRPRSAYLDLTLWMVRILLA